MNKYDKLLSESGSDKVGELQSEIASLRAENARLSNLFNEESERSNVLGDVNIQLEALLHDAREAMQMGSFHHDACPWLGGKECCCSREKVSEVLKRIEAALVASAPEEGKEETNE